MAEFESLGLKAGIWSGLLHRAAPPARVRLFHRGAPVAPAGITAAGESSWRIEAELPVSSLSEGMQSFALVADTGQGEGTGPDAERLAELSLLAGEPLEMDLRAELDLIRAELDLLKREFRRLGRS
ncbi:hypothetical protein [Paracoccus sediminicola]|uniref:hypothetical protein n=1 Tax=Paracoccus sediminicola TaxID=3017783 RepID=UPI0022F13F9D|nr:hypothetical protein [Paracoccus sediminicola]WBU57125.1 hypothetical protein PAF18_01365 [Paracoccus sediminicola]